MTARILVIINKNQTKYQHFSTYACVCHLFFVPLQRILFMNSMIDIFETPASVAQNVAARAKQRRTSMRLTQVELAQKAGLPVATYRRFEQTGKIAFGGLLQIAFALDCLSDFKALFATQTWATMDDMLKQVTPSKRVRHDKH